MSESETILAIQEINRKNDQLLGSLMLMMASMQRTHAEIRRSSRMRTLLVNKLITLRKDAVRDARAIV